MTSCFITGTEMTRNDMTGHEMNSHDRALSIFDLDDTLLDGDSASLFCRYLVQCGLADTAFLAQEAELMARYAEQTLSMPEYVAFMLTPLRRLSQAQVARLMPAYVENLIRPRLYPQALELLGHLRRERHRLLIVSATPAFIVRAVGQALGINEVLAIELVVDANGCFDGRIAGVPTFREGKVERLLQWLEQQQLSLAGAHFYSDSINDLALLERVDFPFATNPDAQLARVAQARDWPLLRWSRAEATEMDNREGCGRTGCSDGRNPCTPGVLLTDV